MVTIHAADATDFSSLGLGALAPSKLEIEERAGGMFELRMTHPMDEAGKWHSIGQWRIIKAPVPVRETPLVEMGHASTTVVRKVYRVAVNTRLRLRTEPSTSTGKIIGRYKNGTRVIQTDVSGSWYKVIVEAGGATGWMHSDYLRYVEDITETVQGDAPGQVIQPRQTREQLFRIAAVERDEANAEVRVTARHIFYDLAGNTVKGDYAPEGVAASEVCAQLMARTVKPHAFQIFCTAEGAVSAEYGGQSIVSALLEKEIGVATQTGARVIRDNFDVFLLADEVRDRGVVIRHGKNLIGAVLTEDASDVVTCIEPVGKGADGKPLYLDGDGVVESPRAAQLPVSRVKRMEYDVSVVAKKADANPEEGKYATEAEARARMREMAAAEFDNGADGVAVRLDVDFVALEGAAGYEQYADLQSIHLYDTVHVQAPRIGINAAVRMTAYVWDALALGGRGKYKSVTLGQLEELQATTYGYDIAGGTVSGTKLISGSVAGDRLRNASIDYAKISVAAIEQLAANSITALTAHIGQIVAGEIEADELYADLATIAVAQITTANIGKANIDWAAIANLSAEVARIAAAQITTANIGAADIDWAAIDSLNAAVAEIAQAKIGDAKITTAQISDLRAEVAKVITLAAQDGKFDFASIRDLLAGAMILEEGVAGSVYIKNLVATRANFVGATLGELVLRGEDGNYYAVTVQADGAIHTQVVTVSDGEISAGQTADGRQIVATTANIAELNASSVRAESAILSEILTGALQAGKISAQEAFLASATVPELRVTALKAIGDTLDISANAQIRLLVSDVATAQGTANAAQSSADAAQSSASAAQSSANAAQSSANAAQSSADAAMAAATVNATAIEQHAQQIALRATQADLSGMASTLRGEMTVAADGIRAEVSEMRVGGVNLVRDSTAIAGRLSFGSPAAGTCWDSAEDGTYTLSGRQSVASFTVGGSGANVFWHPTFAPELVSGQTYTWSIRCYLQSKPGTQIEMGFEGGGVTTKTVTGGWTVFSHTFVCQQTGYTAFHFNGPFEAGDVLFISDFKLESGDKATDWSPSPLDPAGQLKTSYVEIMTDHINVGTGGDLNVDGGSIHLRTSDDFDLSFVRNDGDDVVMVMEDDGTMTFGNGIHARNVREAVTGDIWYPSTAIGGVAGLAKLAATTDGRHVSMTMQNDEYGVVQFSFYSGKITIWAEGHRLPCLEIDKTFSGEIHIIGGVLQSGGTNTFAISQSGGRLVMNDCWFTDFTRGGIYAEYCAEARWFNTQSGVTGRTMDPFIWARYGATVYYCGNIPAGGIWADYAWTIPSGTPTVIGGSSASESGNQSATLAGALGWISTKKGWSDGLAYQGYTTGKGECYGCFRFALPSGAQSIVSAALTLHRKSSTGKGAPVDIHLYGSATAWGSRPALGTQYASRADAVLAGNTVTLDVTAAAQALLAGSIAQLVAYEGDGKTMTRKEYSTDYCAWDVATLDVAYTN